MNQRSVLALALALAAVPAAARQAGADPLGPIAQCIAKGQFRSAETLRRANQDPTRQVEGPNGPATVSVADGYRVMLHKAGKAPLVNLKIELSAPGQFRQDRDAILAQYGVMAKRAAAAGAAPAAAARSEINGVEVFDLTSPTIDRGGPLSMVTLAHEASGVIGTAYVLSQPKDVREYANMEEYTALRDQFTRELAVCMAAKG